MSRLVSDGDEMQDEIELQIWGRRVSTGAHFSTDLDQYKNQTMLQQLVHQTNTASLLEINTDSFFLATYCRIRNASWGAQKLSSVCLEKKSSTVIIKRHLKPDEILSSY
jgi:hypothetical protein